MAETFTEPEQEKAPDNSGKEEFAEEEDRLAAAEETLNSLEEAFVNAKQSLVNLQSSYEALIQQHQEEITVIRGHWSGTKSDLRAHLKTIKEGHKAKIRALKETQKEKKKVLNVEIKAMKKQIPKAKRDLKLLSNRGKLELMLDDDELINTLKERWSAAEVAKRLDYPIFMAVSERGGKNNSGDYEYVTDEAGSLIEFPIGHPQEGQLIVNQDLVNYNLLANDLVDAAKIPRRQVVHSRSFHSFRTRSAIQLLGGRVVAVWSNTALSTIETQFGRFDAEFYKPEFLDIDRSLSAIDGVKLRDVASKIDVGHVGPMVRYYSDTGVRLLQTQNVREFFLDIDNSIRVTPEFHASLIKSQVHKGDILIARSGSFGSAAIYLEDSVINSADIIIVQIDDPRVNSLYVLTFMNTRYGSAQFVRFSSGGVQGHVNLRILEHFQIPIVHALEQERIAEIVQEAYTVRRASAKSYLAAQQFLESELVLDNLLFERPMGYTARLSDLEVSHRTDAQHYQPRFKQLIDHLSAFPTERIRNIRTYNRRGPQPIYMKNGEVSVVNSQHLGPRHIEYDSLQRTSTSSFAAAAEGHIQRDDILIYTTGAYIGRTNVYLNDGPALASNHVNILRLRSGIDTAYMSLIFQSVVGQFQTQKHSRGSAQAELYPTDIDRFVVPLIERDKQQAIGDLLRESLVKQQESQRLIEQAKARVEQLIEEAI